MIAKFQKRIAANKKTIADITELAIQVRKLEKHRAGQKSKGQSLNLKLRKSKLISFIEDWSKTSSIELTKKEK